MSDYKKYVKLLRAEFIEFQNAVDDEDPARVCDCCYWLQEYITEVYNILCEYMNRRIEEGYNEEDDCSEDDVIYAIDMLDDSLTVVDYLSAICYINTDVTEECNNVIKFTQAAIDAILNIEKRI